MARKFQNLETQKLHDRLHGSDKPVAQEHMGEEEHSMEHDMGHEDVVAQHGPAHSITITHDKKKGTHHVHSVHQDGHSHHADFGSAKEAHDHASKMAGMEAGAEPEAEGAMSADEGEGNTGSIPTLGA